LKREYPKAPLPSVGGVVFDREGRVLLIRRGRAPAQGKWSVPGGVIKLGENMEEALKREIFEECGVRVDVDSLLVASSRVVRNEDGKVQYHFVILDYLCQYIDGVPKAGSDACDVRWVAMDQLSEMDLTEGILEVIQLAKERVRSVY
jgi:8-oxo-dGTP diphosphatase